MMYGFGWKKNIRDRRRTPRIEFASRLFLRVTAQVQIVETREVVPGRIFLADLSHKGVGVFLTKPLAKGEEIYIVIDQPRHLFVKGKVAWCALSQRNTRVISAENYCYRAGIQFEFDSEIEQDAVKRYCEELLKTA